MPSKPLLAERRSSAERDLLKKMSPITPDDVLCLDRCTEDFLCNVSDNTYNIEFVRFRIRDMESGSVLFEVNKPLDADTNASNLTSNADPDVARSVHYDFSSEFLNLKVDFKVGGREVRQFRMIERHFFKTELIKTFDFDFGYLMPDTQNTMEHIYDFPALDYQMKQNMINNPYETRSDSFYFANDCLIMHNKAYYAYNAPS